MRSLQDCHLRQVRPRLGPKGLELRWIHHEYMDTFVSTWIRIRRTPYPRTRPQARNTDDYIWIQWILYPYPCGYSVSMYPWEKWIRIRTGLRIRIHGYTTDTDTNRYMSPVETCVSTRVFTVSTDTMNTNHEFVSIMDTHGYARIHRILVSGRE